LFKLCSQVSYLCKFSELWTRELKFSRDVLLLKKKKKILSRTHKTRTKTRIVLFDAKTKTNKN